MSLAPSPRYGAVILSGGRSERMGGRPKALLPVGGTSFLERIASLLDDAGIVERRVVVGVHGDVIRKATALPDEIFVQNPDPDAEMISSFRLGLDSLPLERLDYVFLWPVDHPHVSPATVWAIRDAAAESGAPVALPVHEGRRGHPVVFAADLRGEIEAVPAGDGARAVVHAHAAELAEVTVHDPGVLRDVDTPADHAG